MNAYLPEDIARCTGIEGYTVCDNCRRREPGRDHDQVFIAPEAVGGTCVNQIPKPRPRPTLKNEDKR